MKFRKSLLVVVCTFIFAFILVFIVPDGSSFNCRSRDIGECVLQTTIISALIVGEIASYLKGEISNKELPGVLVQVEDDLGGLRHGVLSAKAASGRLVKNGDHVKLNCSHATILNSKKLCQLEFFGFDPNSTYPKDNPLYGKTPAWTIEVDENGIPDKQLLEYK